MEQREIKSSRGLLTISQFEADESILTSAHLVREIALKQEIVAKPVFPPIQIEMNYKGYALARFRISMIFLPEQVSEYKIMRSDWNDEPLQAYFEDNGVNWFIAAVEQGTLSMKIGGRLVIRELCFHPVDNPTRSLIAVGIGIFKLLNSNVFEISDEKLKALFPVIL